MSIEERSDDQNWISIYAVEKIKIQRRERWKILVLRMKRFKKNMNKG